MDDFVIFSKNKSELKQTLTNIKYFLRDKLNLEIKPPIINSINNGLLFLEFKIYSNKILLSRKSGKKFINKFQKYENNYIKRAYSVKELVNHIEPLFSWIKHSDSLELRNKIINNYGVISERL